MSTIIGNIKLVKAPDIIGLCALQSTYTFVFRQISLLLTKLYKFMMLYSYLPAGFKYNYIVPIPKLIECHR